MMSHTRGPAPPSTSARNSLAFRLSTSFFAALAVLMASAMVPQLALPSPLEWVIALSAAGFAFFLSDALLAITIVALPAVIFVGGMFGLLAR